MNTKVTLKDNFYKISSLLFIALIFISSELMADITYSVDNRRVESSGDDGYGNSYNNIFYPDAPFADWSISGQTSSLTASGFSASGWGDAFSDFGWSSTWSFFDISFTLSTNSQMDINGSLWGDDVYYGSGDASITLYDGNGVIIYSNSVSAYFGYEEVAILYSAVLAAGDYRLVATADPYFQIASSGYNLNAVATPSDLPPGPGPEPEPLPTTGVFEVFDPAGNIVPTNEAGTGNAVTSDVRDINNGTWFLSSTEPFLGVPWTAHSGVIYNTPGVYEIDTVTGGVYTIYLAEGYTMGHILLDWITTDIDVINIWDANGNSIDVDGDGVPGIAMTEGIFPGFSPNFSVGGGATLEINPALQAIDADGDGFNASLDCNDNNASINPGATEIANDGIDQDCDGSDLVIDVDLDGFNSSLDCNDNDASIYPGAPEIPNDGIDQDCNGVDLITDADLDGFEAPLDCNDNDASIYPGAPEIANDGIDQDCDGTDLITDVDGDGFDSIQDCNDNDASIYPGATEIKHDGVDQDCNGYDMTIEVTKAEIKARRTTSLDVVVTSALGPNASLTIEGFGPMVYEANKDRWTFIARKLDITPESITITGVEGSETVVTSLR